MTTEGSWHAEREIMQHEARTLRRDYFRMHQRHDLLNDATEANEALRRELDDARQRLRDTERKLTAASRLLDEREREVVELTNRATLADAECAALRRAKRRKEEGGGAVALENERLKGELRAGAEARRRLEEKVAGIVSGAAMSKTLRFLGGGCV